MMNRNSSRNSILSSNGGSLSYSNSYSKSYSHSQNRRAPADENLDLFSRNRRTLSLSSSDHSSSDVSVKLGRLSMGSAKPGRGGPDDLLTSTDLGKHDYDWLLTPPGTPLFPSSDVNESQPATGAPRTSSLARSASTAKASRLSVSQSESNHSSRPARSSSVTRPSVSSSQFGTYSSNRSSNILNTSSASVSSYTRPSSPITRSPSTARPSTPSARPSVSRSSTPSRARPTPTSSLTDRPRPSQSSRPSTPSSRSQAPASISSAPARTNSRPSTPTRRNSVTPASPSPSSAGRLTSGGRISAPSSRPSSPSPRIRPAQQPVIPPDFPHDTPPNLRTTLPDRPLSAGRSRPGAALTAKGSSESSSPANGNATRRHSSPIVTRGRGTDPPSKGRVYSNGHAAEVLELRKASHTSELGMRKPVKSTPTVAEGTGFGRNISKKSMDMAIRHMDIRNGSGGARSLSSTTLFPQSIRSAAARVQSHYPSSSPESISSNGYSQNGVLAENGNHMGRLVETGYEAHTGLRSAKLSEVDIYESSRYDAMLLKEDLKNMNWLHSIDDRSDQGSIFDSGFESLPEPFGPM